MLMNLENIFVIVYLDISAIIAKVGNNIFTPLKV